MADQNFGFGGVIPGEAAYPTASTSSINYDQNFGPGGPNPGGAPDALYPANVGTLGALLQSEFTNWQKNFVPIELNAMNQLSFNNPNIVPTAVNQAKTMATATSGTMRGILDRQNAGVGVIPTEQQQNVSKRLMDLSQATSIVGAENKAREDVRANDEAILMGGTPNPNLGTSKTLTA